MRGGRVLGAIGRRGHLCGAGPAPVQPRRTAARAAPQDARSEESETSRCSVGFSAAACYTIACRRVETSSLAVAVAFPFPPRVHHGSRLRFPTRPSPLSCATRYHPRISFPASPSTMTTHPHRAARSATAITLEGPQACHRKGGSMFENLKQTAQTAATVAGLAGASLGMERPAEGVLMLPGQSAQSYLGVGNQLQNQTGFIESLNPGSTNGYASVSFINSQYAITCGHVVWGTVQNGGSFRVGTGANYFTDRGQVVDVAEVITYPGYAGGVATSSPDIAILRLAAPLSGVTQVEFGTASPFDVVVSGGYGVTFFAGEPSVPRDGFRRGWNAPVKTGAPLFGSDQWYNYTQFGGGGGSAVPVNGKALSGDSGGGVYNSQGQLVGINFAQTGNGASVGSTSYLDLSQPEVLSWLQANTIPTPGTVGLLGLAALGPRGRKRK
jgi:hypothetical protein